MKSVFDLYRRLAGIHISGQETYYSLLSVETKNSENRLHGRLYAALFMCRVSSFAMGEGEKGDLVCYDLIQERAMAIRLSSWNKTYHLNTKLSMGSLDVRILRFKKGHWHSQDSI